MYKFLGLVGAVFVSIFLIGSSTSAEAGQSCKKGYYFNTNTLTCVQKVRVSIGAQDSAASGGPQWGPVNAANCAKASREMDRAAAQCRSYDARRGAYDADLKRVVDGKLLRECAKCCRQLREGMNRWIQCFAKGFTRERPDYVSARRSAEAMNCPETY